MTIQTIRATSGSALAAQLLRVSSQTDMRELHLQLDGADTVTLAEAGRAAEALHGMRQRGVTVKTHIGGRWGCVEAPVYLIAAAGGKVSLADEGKCVGPFSIDVLAPSARAPYLAAVESYRPGAAAHFQGNVRMIGARSALAAGLVDAIGTHAPGNVAHAGRSVSTPAPKPMPQHLQAALSSPQAYTPPVKQAAPTPPRFDALPASVQARDAKAFATQHGLTFPAAFQVLEDDAKGQPVGRAKRYAIEHKCSLVDAFRALELQAH
jgi:hypothetical protein